MFRKKYIRVRLFCASALLLIVSLILDIRIADHAMPVLFPVSEDYISSIFSGILTFSTLSLTVLSMIVSVLDTQNYGLKLRDIVSFDASPIRFTRYILISMALTLFSVAALAFELYTFISAVAVIAIVYTTVTSIEVFKIISDGEFCKQIVFAEIENQKTRSWDKYIDNWINEYKNAIIRNYKPEIKMYAEILKKCSESTDTGVFVNHLQDLFETACKNHPAAEAIDLAFHAIGMSSHAMDICSESIQSIRYYDTYDIMKLDLPAAVDSIINAPYPQIRLVGSQKEKLSYYYFSAVIQSRIPPKEKLELLAAMIDKITQISDDEQGAAKSRLIDRIVTSEIICTNSEINEQLYELLMKSLYCNNLTNENPILIATAARILRCIFFYSTLAIGILDEAKRNKIAEMGKRPIMIDNISEVSITTWIIRFRTEFLSFYIQDAFEMDWSIFGNTDTNIGAIEAGMHCMLWTRDNKIRYALWYYFAFRSTPKIFPLQAHLNGIPKLRESHWETCKCLLGEFQEDGSLTDRSITFIKALSAFDSHCSQLYIFPVHQKNAYSAIKDTIDSHTAAAT